VRGGVACVVAEAGGVAGVSGKAEGSDREVAQAGHGSRGSPGPHAGGVLSPGSVAYVVELVVTAGGRRKDEGERMAAPLGPARIGHRGQAVRQAEVFLRPQRPGSSQLAQTGRDGR
jgi:hypothetical protein